jgi:hypothetical protein
MAVPPGLLCIATFGTDPELEPNLLNHCSAFENAGYAYNITDC